MSLFNVIWFIFFGWSNAILVIILAGFMAITIIGYPIAKSLFQFAILVAFPFGKTVIRETELKGKSNVSVVRKIGGFIANIIWFPFGLFLALLYFLLGIIMFMSLVGIPIGIVLVKMGQFILFPIGAKVVTTKQAYASAVANEIEKREASKNKKGVKTEEVVTTKQTFSSAAADEIEKRKALKNTKEIKTEEVEAKKAEEVEAK